MLNNKTDAGKADINLLDVHDFENICQLVQLLQVKNNAYNMHQGHSQKKLMTEAISME